MTHLRAGVLLIAGAGALAYALFPPGRPEWIGIAGTLLGVEPLARVKGADDS